MIDGYNIMQTTLSNISPISAQTASSLVSAMQLKTFNQGETLEFSGQRIKFEFIIVKGIVRKYLTNADADEFTIDFFMNQQAITPAILRSKNFISFVNLQVISPTAEIMLFSHKEMETTMQGFKDLEIFGHKILMDEAYKRAEREKVLLTASGKEKLEWFRKNYPNLENEIPHYYIASFLGITPTSLSRLRKHKPVR